jgi:hypothetical protein
MKNQMKRQHLKRSVTQPPPNQVEPTAERKPGGYGKALLIGVAISLLPAMYFVGWLTVKRDPHGVAVWDSREQEKFYRPLEWLHEKITGKERDPPRRY